MYLREGPPTRVRGPSLLFLINQAGGSMREPSRAKDPQDYTHSAHRLKGCMWQCSEDHVMPGIDWVNALKTHDLTPGYLFNPRTHFILVLLLRVIITCSVLRVHSWWVFGNHVGFRGSNLSQLCVSQEPWPLYCISLPSSLGYILMGAEKIY